MNSTTDQHGLSLPGYTLLTRLGAGGYGEVWLAHAPGGLDKAVKFIFGSFHEKRAEHELKALQRMRDLRHPFLLSLERIEVVDDRLAIVTELADSSLKDRFDECRREGLPGIPRGELLKYLGDAADALDFLSAKHALQHLDVKPENLLLLSGHVKVADFGLVKDVGQGQASLVGGLTPLYSAPEVFQGNPSARSDQYSLAVLYQEMLTGALPFGGATAAELTMQHLHDEPDLSALAITDRYVLARALSKDPTHRFASCTEMISALMAAPTGEGGDWPTASVADSGEKIGFQSILTERRGDTRRGAVTEFFDEQVKSPRREISPSMLLDWRPTADTPSRRLPAIDVATSNFSAQPTLVIGIGGVAATVLRQLRLRLSRQFGDEPLAAVQMLLLDSDPKAIAQALDGDSRGALAAEETLALPLRRPQEYRDQSTRLLRWLSRRWLYNIPKSLRTEGLRPLGRLAFADHALQAVQRIRLALSRGGDAEARRSTAERTGVAFREGTARVYVVASILGGAGSGMSLDVGFAVRAALEKAGLVDAPIIGVFLHATGADPRHCDLARVNAYAWLTEYNHFHRANAEFPGDESCGLPPLGAGKRAFDSTYLIDAGAESEAEGLASVAQRVAEYVYLDAMTPAQKFFDQCRREPTVNAEDSADLRTFTIRKVAAVGDASIDQVAASLSRAVVLHWVGAETVVGSRNAVADLPNEPDLPLVERLRLTLEGLATDTRELIEGQFGDQRSFIDGLIGTPGGPVDLVGIVDRIFETPEEQAAGAWVMQRPVDAIVGPLTIKLAGELARWVLRKLDERQQRLAGAHGAARWLATHLTRLETDASRLASGLATQIAARAEQLRRGSRSGSAWSEQDRVRAMAYFRMRIDQQAILASAYVARRLLAELKTVRETVAEVGRQLKHLAASMPHSDELGAGDALAQAFRNRLAELVDAVDRHVQSEFVSPNGGLFQTLMGNSRVRVQLLADVTKEARRAVEQLATDPEIAHAAFTAQGVAAAGEGGAPWDASPPEFLNRGGVYRGLVVLPRPMDGVENSGEAAAMTADASVMTGVDNDLVLCQEAWGLPLAKIAVDLIQGRRDYADFAARVVTRSDVAWTSLTAAPVDAFAAVVDGSAFAESMPALTRAL